MSISGATPLSEEENDLFYESMFRITDGLPAHELHQIAKEAADCEEALMKEIELLEASLTESDDKVGGESSTGPDQEGGNGEASAAADGGKDSSKPPAAAAAPSPVPPPSSSTIPLAIPIIPPEYDATNVTAQNYLSTAEKIISSELSPLDRYFTVSALLGRLREPFDTPPPPHSGLFKARQAAIAAAEKKKKSSSSSSSVNSQEMKKVQGCKKYQRLLDLKKYNKIYTQDVHDNTENLGVGIGDTTAMLALVKRISNHRTATVFRRAVNPLEAPGYTDRILFPIDLTLIKKMVLCGYIRTFEELHQQIGMICHNCVKFNGRDSDYSMLTREFETYVDDSFLDFMQKQQDKATAAMAAAAATSG